MGPVWRGGHAGIKAESRQRRWIWLEDIDWSVWTRLLTVADPGAGGVVRHEAGVPRAAPWLSLYLLCPFHYRPPVNTLDSKGAHRQQGGWGGVILNTSGAKKTDKDKQNDKRGGMNKNKGTRFWRKGEGGEGWADQARLFVRLGRHGGSIWSLVFICAAVLHW